MAQLKGETPVTEAKIWAPPGRLPADQAWWADRFRTRYPDAGPPLFRRRSSVYRRKSMRVELPLTARLWRQIEATGGGQPERLHELCLAALAGVLYRYAGATAAEGIVVGAPPLESAPADVLPQLLPLLVKVAADMPCADLFCAAATSIAQSYQRADCSIMALTETLGMGEVTNRHPLLAVALGVSGYHQRVPDLRNDVTVTVRPAALLELEYNANVHDEATIVRFGQHIVAFLACGLADPGRAVRAVDYLAAGERAQLLAAASGGPAELSDGRCLHELVEAAAGQHPDADAIIFGEQAVSYGELDARANQLANYLRSLGAGVGSQVGICLPACAELLISVLAVLKSGAAAVPVVPTFPASRNAMTVQDSAMGLAVTHEPLRGLFAEPGPTLVCVDQRAAEIARFPAANPHAGAAHGDLVYIMFTSGSTGRPKGVAVEHKTLVNLVGWQRRRGVDPAGRRTLQRSSIGFDVSFQEIFATWAFGGCLVVAPDEVRDDVALLPQFIERNAIARVFLPPVALDQIAVTASLEGRSLTTLEEVIVAGEQLQISMPTRRLFHQLDCTLDNQYGPTETHVVTAFTLDGPSTRWAETPPIGKPVSGVSTYVLDPWLQPVPTGVPGEIYVGGIAPARGYLDERQTGERFRTDPFAPAGGRMYKTGDRARMRGDGNIEFLGRADDQVKIRGYRIELGEIETNLLLMPGIRHAVAAVCETGALGRRLAAYVVTAADGQPDAASIRQFLLDRLPGHMVPATSAIVHLTALPTTATGKVDRRALPPLARVAAADPVAAEGETEQTVARIWARSLEIERVGRDDNFADLGGHSLIGIQVVAQLNELYSIALPLRSLLRGTTVAALAAEIDSLRAAAAAGAAAGSPVVAGPAATAQHLAPPDAGGPALHYVALPDGRRVACLTPAETRYLYLDVFEHRTYDRGGIRYPKTGCVFDVGAHVGLFTLYALGQSPGAAVFAFEPCPPLFEALRRNTGQLPGVRLFPFALSSHRDTAQLTFYPNLTGMSSFHPDAAHERALLSGILRNLAELDGSSASILLADSAEYLDERLLMSTFSCERRTLSDVLSETGVDRVDLLKIDVQKAELEVLAGISAADWPKIDQLAIELHDLDGRLATIRSLLADRGYRVTVEQDSLHAGTVVHFVYAVRAP
jgi:amino acid adenylation domain-containing protein/FkbM family methyltransferase